MKTVWLTYVLTSDKQIAETVSEFRILKPENQVIVHRIKITIIDTKCSIALNMEHATRFTG